MTALPIKRIILYKHGVGYFERRGTLEGDTLRLSFPRPAMDDVLKSLVALDLGSGQVLGLDFETPENRNELLAKGSIHLSDTQTLLDLVRDLRGRQVRCTLHEARRQTYGEQLEGLVVGVNYGGSDTLAGATLSLYRADSRSVTTLPLADIQTLALLDETAASDLTYFLRAAQSEEDRRSAALHLSPGDHDLLVGYIAPAPSWRVSYRILAETERKGQNEGQNEGQNGSKPDCSLLLQGWGLFDNQLEEDLEEVELTLVAGMPVSFRYRLYEPRTPERPLIEDEERTINAPLFFESAPPPAPQQPPRARGYMKKQERAVTRLGAGAAFSAADVEEEEAAFGLADMNMDDMSESVQISTTGSERGALFAYRVGHPVSVARGQSAMVPILGKRLSCRRDLLYNRQKLPDHPVASLRLTNETGLTLERGPVTVIENGDYAGEAVVPFTRDGGELIVPYAVELGIKVKEKHDNERRTVAISVRDDYLLIQEYDIHHTTYHLTSTLSHETAVMVEHVPRQGYELSDTPDPLETSADFVRWQVSCAPNARTLFEVRERRMRSRKEKVRTLNGHQLQTYLHNKFLDAATVKALEEVLQVYRKIGEASKQMSDIEKDRQSIHKQQKQIQGNLGPLSHEGEEGNLRKRYVGELNRLEDRLAELEAEEQRQRKQIDSLEEQARQKLRALNKG